jgi:prephenate dehydratase
VKKHSDAAESGGAKELPWTKGSEMAKLELYSVVVRDKPGKGAQVLRGFQEAGVNFIGIWGYPAGKSKSRIDLVPEDPALLKKAAKKLKIDLGKKQTTFHITGEDHPGAVAEALAKLAAKEINVYAVQALCGGNGRFGAMIQVDEDDVKKAGKALA